jgi:hypothetical protein
MIFVEYYIFLIIPVFKTINLKNIDNERDN